MGKIILVIILGIIAVSLIAGAYFILTKQQNTQQTTPQQNQPQENQQSQQEEPSTTGQEQSAEPGISQEETSFDSFIKNIQDKPFKLSSTFSYTAESSGVTYAYKGRFEMVFKDGKYKYFYEITQSSEDFKGEMLFFKFPEENILIYCFKNDETENQWICYKTITEIEEAGEQLGSGLKTEDPTTVWEEYKNDFTYEGVKNIHGVALYCFFANHIETNSNVEQHRVCFDPQLNFFRYYWIHGVSSIPEETYELEIFVDSVTFNVADEEFVPPVEPLNLPGTPGG